jgi:demethylmenaquinone methyltransferase / 2-methoxy-6-polyprenyl-1,4-benzoquinol methylase
VHDPLRESIATPDAKRRYVRRLFATIADRYDLITVFLSYGRDRAWKRRLISMSGASQGTRALDLACGTGDIAFAVADRGATVTGLDVTFRMLEIAQAKARSRSTLVALVAGDMMELPFADGSFDLVTTGYGIRNVPRIEPAIEELRRVLRPGGLLLSLDFNRPDNALVRGVYLSYLTVVGSALGWVLHRDPDTYRYIPESIKRYPGAHGVARLLSQAGFADCGVVPLLGGLMAINTARRPIGPWGQV